MYRDHKTFQMKVFDRAFKRNGKVYNNISVADFHSEFLYLSRSRQAPVKTRYIRDNQKNFMDKELKQVIMVRSKLHSKFLKAKTEEKIGLQMLSSATIV